jgi:hypothetical protein
MVGSLVILIIKDGPAHVKRKAPLDKVILFILCVGHITKIYVYLSLNKGYMSQSYSFLLLIVEYKEHTNNRNHAKTFYLIKIIPCEPVLCFYIHHITL